MSSHTGIKKFLNSLSLPKSCLVNKTIFKKQLYENVGLKSTDKKLITNHVEKVTWQYCLKPDTINIQSYTDNEYEFLEIQVIEARLNDDTRYQRIAEIIMRGIPYPMILQFTYGTNLMIAAGIPRINLADRQKHTIEEFVYSPWIESENPSPQDQNFFDSIQSRKLSFTNFYRYYFDFVDQLYLYKAAKMVDRPIKIEDPLQAHRVQNEIVLLDREITNLKAQIKKDNMFNKKVEINVAIKKLENRKRELLITI